MQSTRLTWTNARAQQAILALAATGHGVYCERAVAFVISAITNNSLSWPTLLNLFDLVVAVERNLFKKSWALNALVNFCVANGDGFTVQHQLLNKILGNLIEKYY
ncbi:unknown [Orgyia pseudotsugata multiple nucleopolyhedrovirus]|uniref:Uncharacterized 11.6 kDa protein n=1 Tax=Orgyia pseudotsugata multicapsid polyhedrosis virus TaxID=262177 RepID=Y019_NPVOP|nr:hypothetical protein OpmnVgp018 [Orgyia pseudotsugata multiple nucleopolyhedrovirus]O10279.1 RecName: Full=Uncharacterized 11.6 kDa protein [Orgyia pseudotsugata multiple nucleopolyhedrovirus]pir/T10287/ hypothetical protein 18 - Orgyia pseudotsugata nuclear polyhedrosis virus [Orgyia pseudotsugata single capsid nuclopolyhedrovirus]AKR14217.1 hypothetical protein [Dasychira pudibunda nucleopolyhedrovirus]AAC59017.1 unknown [Orgyia pseudotsugata multiple nucleopolyhedrovirus]WHM28443.1 hypot